MFEVGIWSVTCTGSAHPLRRRIASVGPSSKFEAAVNLEQASLALVWAHVSHSFLQGLDLLLRMMQSLR